MTIKQFEKDQLTLLLAVAYFKDSKQKPEDYIKGYDKDKFQEAANKILYFKDENEFHTGLETMLTQTYKKIVKQQYIK